MRFLKPTLWIFVALLIVGMPATARREGDNGRDASGVFACKRQCAPAAGRMPDDDGAVLTNEGLATEIVQRQHDLPGSGAS